MTGARGALRRGILVVAVGALTAAGIAISTTSSEAAKPDNKGNIAKARFFSFNDFHGALDAPGGSGAAVNGVPAGGAEYLATTLKGLRADAEANGQKTLTVGAGDMVGATPLLSAAFHDEPTIETLNLLQMDVTSVGNHEFDEGVDELLRLQYGGCHPTDGCQDGDPYYGADFPYLAANTVYKDSGETILPAWTTRMVQGVRVGFVGMTLKGTPGIVNPAGITEVNFLDEVETANKYAGQLLDRGVEAIVLLIHEGGQQSVATNPSGCTGFTGALPPIVAGLDPEFDLVVSGHTHRPYVCSLPNSAGKGIVATSAGTNGQLVTDITAELSKSADDFTSISAQNVVVENGVKLSDGTYQRTSPNGPFVLNPALVDAETKALIDEYRVAVAPIANRIVGTISANITRSVTELSNQESALGDVIADAQLAYTATSAGAQIAFMNPGGIRTDLVYGNSSGGEAPGQVTYGEAFAVQPFNNLVTTQTFTRDQIKAVLEQQRFPGTGATSTLVLQVSAGFTYTYDTTAPAGSRVSNMALNGVPLGGGSTTYRVTTNDFLANGGDGFTALTAGTNRVYAPGFDVDALAAYLNPGPIGPGPQNRITRVP